MKICSTDGCDQQILLRPAERDVCEGCRVRGGPPPVIVISEETGLPPADWGSAPRCRCGRPILQPEVSGEHCARCARELPATEEPA